MKTFFFIIFFTIMLTLNGLVFLRTWQALTTIPSIRPIFLFCLIGGFLAMLIGMIFGNYMPQSITKIISLIGFTYLILFVYLSLNFILVDVVRIANFYFHFAPFGMAAFRLWTMIGTLVISIILMGYGSYKFNNPAVVTLNLSSEKAIQHKQLKIVAASDIHLGNTIDKKRLKSYVTLINNQQPDIVLLAGDVSDRSMIPVIKQNMDEELREIKAPLGVFAISGNHEYFAETPTMTADYLKNAGITYLKDDVALIDNSFYVLGRDDRSNANRKNLDQIVNGLDKNKPKILLDHQPFHLEDAEKNDIDLQISGHTHNGQFFPGNFIVKTMYELAYGYLKKGKTHYYVSSGLGLWGPQYRIGTQSEIVVINLKY